MILALSIMKYVLVRFMKKISWPLVFVLTASIQCQKTGKKNISSSPGTVSLKEAILVQGLNFPWEILWGPDNFIWMTEREGRISRVNPVTGSVIPLLTVSQVVNNNEGGMLGMVLHPNFSATPQLFVAYDYNNANDYREKIVRYTYNGTTLVDPITIIDNIHASSIHNGCRLLITPESAKFICC